MIVTGDAVAAIVKLAVLETPPPGFWTVMLALPTFVIRVPGTVAVNCVAFTKVVKSGEPFHCTVGQAVKIPPEDRKLFPKTVRLNVDPPAIVEPGLSDVMTGLATVTALILNVSPLEAVLPAFITVTLALPIFAIRLPGTTAVLTGTAGYMAPELFSFPPIIDKPVDVYAYGAMMFVFFSGKNRR